MTTIVRRFLAIFGIKADTGPLKGYEDGVEGAAKATKKAIEETKKWGEKLETTSKWLGTAAVAGVGGLVHSLSASTAEVQRWSLAFGVGVEEVQKLGFAATSVGLELEDMADIMNTLGERAFDAIQDPGTEAAELFKKMGVQVKDLNGQVKPSRELLDELANGFQRVKNPTEQAALASILLGDVGVKMLPALQGGAEGLKAYGIEAERMGVVLKEDSVNGVIEFNSAMTTFKAAVKGAGQQIALQFLPAMTKAAKGMVDWFKTGDNARRVVKFLTAAAKILAVVLAAVVAGKVIAGYLSFVKAIQTAVVAFKALRVAAIAANAKILLIPAIIVGLLLLLEDLAVWLRGGDSLVGRFVDRWKEQPGVLGNIARGLDAIKPKLQGLFSEASSGLAVLGDMFAQSADDFKENVLPLLGELAAGFMEMVREVGPPLFEMIMKIRDVFRATMRATLPAFIWLFKTSQRFMMGWTRVIVRLLGAAFAILAKIWAKLLPVIGAIFAKIIEIVNGLLPYVESTFNGIAEIIEFALDKVVPFVEEKVDAVAEIFSGLSGAITEIIDFITPKIAVAASMVIGFAQSVADFWTNIGENMRLFWDGLVTVIDAILVSMIKGFGKGVNFLIGLLEPLFAALQSGIDAANELGAGIDVNLTGGLKKAQAAVTKATTFDSVISTPAQTEQNSKDARGFINAVKEINVQIQGSTNMGAADVARATQAGVNGGMKQSLKEAGRDFSSAW